MTQIISAFCLTLVVLTSSSLAWRKDLHLQTTLGKAVTFSSIGLFTGENATVTLKPSPVDTGIAFKRIDLPPNTPLIPANWKFVTKTTPTTTLGHDEQNQVFGFENLLATFYALGIDNAIVEINSAEVPILNGTPHLFMKLVYKAGIVNLGQPKRYILINQSTSLKTANANVSLDPAKNPLEIHISLNCAHPSIPSQQSLRLTLNSVTFFNELALARPSAFVALHQQKVFNQIALGVNETNCIVYNDWHHLNGNMITPLTNNMVRHEAVHCISDLSLCGARLIGNFTAFQPDHELMIELINAFMDESQHLWSYCTP